MINPDFNILAGLINLSSCVLYAADTVRGRNQPNRVTWTLWTAIPLIAFAAQAKHGVGLQTILTLSFGLSSLLILAASFYNKKSYWKIRSLDIACGSVSLIALFFLVFTRQVILSLILSMVADFMAGLPTVIKAYQQPSSESSLPFFVGIFASVISLLTIGKWQFAAYSFGLYALLNNLLIGILAARSSHSSKAVG